MKVDIFRKFVDPPPHSLQEKGTFSHTDRQREVLIKVSCLSACLSLSLSVYPRPVRWTISGLSWTLSVPLDAY